MAVASRLILPRVVTEVLQFHGLFSHSSNKCDAVFARESVQVLVNKAAASKAATCECNSGWCRLLMYGLHNRLLLGSIRAVLTVVLTES